MPDFSVLPQFLLASLAFGGIVIFRYLLVSGFFFVFFYRWKPGRWRERKINEKAHSPHQYQREMGWSVLTSLIFGVFGALTALGWQLGYFRIYTELSVQDLLYMPFSILAALFIQETYYYWLHRAMHHPRMYRYVHRVHHDSLITSPWTSFSFHPLESVLQALIFPLVLLVVPMHPIAIVFLLTLMTVTSVINHLDIELYPCHFERHWLGQWLIGATHHSLHHKQFRYNFGLYFTFWDKWMNTESPFFKSLFKKKTTPLS
jgi:sterol desaturase/sphingolipid hydroxylase (fatty acid hydroxylase superfamily)